jgi:carbon storage regulator
MTMLVLSRKPGEKVLIGEGITVTILQINGRQVRIGIEADDSLRILRGELAQWHDEFVTADEPLGGRHL